MKLSNALFVLTGIMALSSVAIARPQTSDIELQGGQAGPRQAMNIPLNTLMDNVQYNIICQLKSDAKSTETFDDIKVMTTNMNMPGNGVEFHVNGQKLDATGQVNIPKTLPSQLVAYGIYKSHGSISIINLDDTDTITATICYAEPWRS